MQELIQRLNKYAKKGIYPFHMPGHKRNMRSEGFKNPYKIDITEIEGFDDLHHAEGILLEAELRAARIYGSDKTHFLINGSTAGILSAISAVTSQQGKLLMARNSHKAAYHVVLLRQLETIFVHPTYISKFDLNGGISPQEIKNKLHQEPEIEAVYITSPTAEGMVSDIKEIARICHDYNKPLIVDEAHGAHFGFSKEFPNTSIKEGADIVVASVHKTLPSFTQTALLHINGNLVEKEKIQEYLSIYQTSSPSYILMCSIDRCMRILETESKKLFYNLSKNLIYFHKKTDDLQIIKILKEKDLEKKEIKSFDPSKIIISVRNTMHDGIWLQSELLKKYKLQMEMATPTYVLAISTIMDRKKGFKRLQKALRKIDKQLIEELLQERKKKHFNIEDEMEIFRIVEVVYPCYRAKEMSKMKKPLREAEGLISGEFVYLYPPGIPLIVPGERMNKKMIEQIEIYKKIGLSIQGMHDKTAFLIEVVEE